jgi:ribosomal protein L37AE/L43A
MLSVDSGYFPRFETPHHNPCAQCGRPIAAPEWVEEDRQAVAYLWHCHACGYKFESMAFFARPRQGVDAIAA